MHMKRILDCPPFILLPNLRSSSPDKVQLILDLCWFLFFLVYLLSAFLFLIVDLSNGLSRQKEWISIYLMRNTVNIGIAYRESIMGNSPKKTKYINKEKYQIYFCLPKIFLNKQFSNFSALFYHSGLWNQFLNLFCICFAN